MLGFATVGRIGPLPGNGSNPIVKPTDTMQNSIRAVTPSFTAAILLLNNPKMFLTNLPHRVEDETRQQNMQNPPETKRLYQLPSGPP
jgi:hypothetical protein